MINPDDLTCIIVERNLQSKRFVLLNNAKATHDIWRTDFSLVGHKPDVESSNLQQLDGWAACNHCFASYRILSKKDKSGSRKNYGLNALHAHRKNCKKKPVTKASGTVSHPQQQTTIPRFAYRTNKLSEKMAKKLKDAELKFVVAGAHSFRSLENGGLMELMQVTIDIGCEVGKVSARDVMYGRKTIRNEAIEKLHLLIDSVRSQLKDPIKQHCIAATCDLWTDDMIKRSYLDFTVFWIDENNQLNHSLLRCKYFSADTKSAINIWREIREIFETFHLPFGDTPIVTDQGANIVAACRITNEARYPCMAHRCSTMLETAWTKTEAKNKNFSIFNHGVRELRKYVQQSGGIQEHLPKTLKSASGIRPWRSYHLVHESLHSSYEELAKCLRERNGQHRLYQIDARLLAEIADFMGKFSLIFDNLEFSNRPTIQNVVRSYYQMMKYAEDETCPNGELVSASEIIKEIKFEVRKSLDEKYFPSITLLHWVATYLKPTFKTLSFVRDEETLMNMKDEIRKGLHLLVRGVVDDSNIQVQAVDSVTQAPTIVPRPKRFKEDPFATLRSQQTSIATNPLNAERDITAELNRQIQGYESMAVPIGYEDNPLLFWKEQTNSFHLLAKIAKSVLVIPASSAESERHFSIAGQVVDEQRACLDPECVEALVVLKEAYLNNMWPSS